MRPRAAAAVAAVTVAVAALSWAAPTAAAGDDGGQAPPRDRGEVRVVNLTDAEVTADLDGGASATPVEAGAATPRVEVPAGQVELRVVDDGGSVLYDDDVQVPGGGAVSAVAWAEAEGSTKAGASGTVVSVLRHDVAAAERGHGRVEVVGHAPGEVELRVDVSGDVAGTAESGGRVRGDVPEGEVAFTVALERDEGVETVVDVDGVDVDAGELAVVHVDEGGVAAVTSWPLPAPGSEYAAGDDDAVAREVEQRERVEEANEGVEPAPDATVGDADGAAHGPAGSATAAGSAGAGESDSATGEASRDSEDADGRDAGDGDQHRGTGDAAATSGEAGGDASAGERDTAAAAAGQARHGGGVAGVVSVGDVVAAAVTVVVLAAVAVFVWRRRAAAS